jgi:hypothetical protein
LSTHAIRTSEASVPPAPAHDRRGGGGGGELPGLLRAFRYLDLAILALALPIFLVAGLPLLGWGATAGAWLLQRAIRALTERQVRQSDDPRTLVGLTAASMIARGWLMALTIFGAGLIENDAGLSAAILAIVLFTVFFSGEMILRPFGPTGPQRKGAR